MSNNTTTTQSDKRHSKLSRGQANLVRSYARLIADLPLSEFHISEYVHDSDEYSVQIPYVERPSELVRLRTHGIVKKVDKLSYDGSLFHVWIASEEAVIRAREYLEQSETAVPGCPHTGVRNVPNGGYTCCNGECDNEVAREMVME